MNDILTLSSQGDDTLNKIFTGKPYLLNIEGSINICMTLCGQEIDGCSVVNFANMKNIGKALVLNIDSKKNYKCSIQLAFDSSSDSTNSNGMGTYKLEKVFFTTPSLHKVNNTVYDMEIFVVYSSTQKNGDKLYVCMCSFVQGVDTVQQYDWRFTSFKLMNELFGDITKIPPVNSTNPINSPPNPIDVNHFLPREGYRNFYEYTHPMNNMVNFRIFQTPLYASKQVINNIQSQILPGTQFTNFKQMIQSYINPSKGVFIFFSQDMTKNVDAALNGQLMTPGCAVKEDLKTNNKKEKKKTVNDKKKKKSSKKKSSKKSSNKKSSNKKSSSKNESPSKKSSSKKKKEKFSNQYDSDSDYESDSDLEEKFKNNDSDEDSEDEDDNEDFENNNDSDEDEDFENNDDDDEDFEDYESNNDDDDEDFENSDSDDEDNNKNKKNTKEEFKSEPYDSIDEKRKNFTLGMLFLSLICLIIVYIIFIKYEIPKLYLVPIFLIFSVLTIMPYMLPRGTFNKTNNGKEIFDGKSLYGFRQAFTHIFMLFILFVFIYKNYNEKTLNKPMNIIVFIVWLIIYMILINTMKYKKSEVIEDEEIDDSKQFIKFIRARNLTSLSLGYFIAVPFIFYALINKVLNDPTFKNSQQTIFDQDSVLNAFANPKFRQILSDKLWIYVFIIIQIIFTSFVFLKFLLQRLDSMVTMFAGIVPIFSGFSMFYVGKYYNDRMELNLNDYTLNKLDTYSIFSLGLSFKEIFSLLTNPNNTVITSKLTLVQNNIQSGGTSSNQSSQTNNLPEAIPEEVPGPNNVIGTINSQLSNGNFNNLEFLRNSISSTAIMLVTILLIVLFVVTIILVAALTKSNNSYLTTGWTIFCLVIFVIFYIICYVLFNQFLANKGETQSYQEFVVSSPIPSAPPKSEVVI